MGPSVSALGACSVTARPRLGRFSESPKNGSGNGLSDTSMLDRVSPLRTRRLQTSRSLRPALAAGITEGAVARPILGREGVYRRGLAVADVGAALAALAVVAVVANPRGALILLGFAPLIVLVNKIAGLYDRDELVMNKTTLDEAPALLQITGLFTLLVWMGHDAVVRWGLDPSSVLVMWVALLGLTLTLRTAARRWASAWTKPERCLVIGAKESADALASKLESSHVRANVVARVPLESPGGMI